MSEKIFKDINYLRQKINEVEEKALMVLKFGKQRPLIDSRACLREIKDKCTEMQRELLNWKKR